MPNDMTAPELDLDKMTDSLAAELTGSMDLPADDPVDAAVDAAADAAAPATGNRDELGRFKANTPAPAADAAPAPDAAAPVVDDLPVPKSWAKETHALWQKAAKGEPLTKDETRTLLTTFNTREAQMADGAKAYATDAEYGRSMRSVISRNEDLLRAQSLPADKAVEYFFNSHRQLSTGTEAQKIEYIGKIAAHYGIKLPAAGPAAPADPNAPAPIQLPPEVKAALDKVERLEGVFTEQQRQQYAATMEKTSQDVNAFAADPKHPYFDECADHICLLLKGDPNMKLETAYDTAVWANPVTRQKELARLQQERDEANRKKAQEAAAAAKKSTSTNLRGRDTARAPQAPAATLKNLDDVMRETHEEMRSRVE